MANNLIARIIVIDKTEAPLSVDIDDKTALYYGKNKIDIQINEEIMPQTGQRKLGVISYEDKKWYYLNQSDIVTTIRNEKIKKNEKVEIRFNDIIRFKHRKRTPLLLFKEVTKHKESWDSIMIGDENQIIVVNDNRDVSEPNHLDIFKQESEIESEHYAKMTNTAGKWFIEDCDTYHGIMVNGEKIDQKTELFHHDVISMAETTMVLTKNVLVYNHRVRETSVINVDIKDRTVNNYLKKKILLKDINLTLYSGEMVLLLGGSGAGKTTLINAITGYEKANATITLNDTNIYREYKKMQHDIGVVPQSDLLRMDDTVYKTLWNAAQMRLPLNLSDEERESRVDHLLALFGLDNRKDALVSKLSGGQRKRLSICVEYIADPSIFILDEPDSGLDGVLARELMVSLRSIANRNKFVIVITHTPDRVIDLFDKVIVLAVSQEDHSGHLAFYGTIPEARRFFECKTMEDIVLAINPINEGGLGHADLYIEKYKAYQQEKVEDTNDGE